MNEQEMQQTIIAAAVDKVVKAIVGDYFNRSQMITQAQNKVAERAADAWLEQHLLDVVKALDLDAITKLATLRVLEKFVQKIGQS